MKRLLALVVLLGSVVLVGATAPAAYAKGATDVWISGPGMEKVVLGYTRRADDVDVGLLAEVSGIYLIYGAAIATTDPGLSTQELGPRYVLTWYTGSTVMKVSHVYPFTTQGAWTHIPYEDGGWVRGGPDLEQAMVELGAERPAAVANAETSAGSTAVGPTTRSGLEPVDSSSAVGSGSRTAWAAFAALAVLVAGGAWLLRRRRADAGGSGSPGDPDLPPSAPALNRLREAGPARP